MFNKRGKIIMQISYLAAGATGKELQGRKTSALGSQFYRHQ